MPRAVRSIQTIIQVMKPTATIEREPPMISWASKLRPYAPNVSTAPMPSESAIASPTPRATQRIAVRRPVLARYATTIPTMSEASSPSRRPMVKFASKWILWTGMLRLVRLT